MITVDISNVWGQLTLADLLAIEQEVADAHAALADGTGEGSEYLGWLNLPVREATDEMKRIQAAAKKIRESSDVHGNHHCRLRTYRLKAERKR